MAIRELPAEFPLLLLQREQGSKRSCRWGPSPIPSHGHKSRLNHWHFILNHSLHSPAHTACHQSCYPTHPATNLNTRRDTRREKGSAIHLVYYCTVLYCTRKSTKDRGRGHVLHVRIRVRVRVQGVMPSTSHCSSRRRGPTPLSG